MAYIDSDYTVVIAMMQWHKIKIIVLKLTLVVEIWTLLSHHRWPPLLERFPTSGGSTVLRKGTRRFWPHGRDRCRSLTLTCRNSPCWLSCECCNNTPLLAIDWAWLPRGMCVNWNELQLALALALRRGCNAAMNGSWDLIALYIISDLPYIYQSWYSRDMW